MSKYGYFQVNLDSGTRSRTSEQLGNADRQTFEVAQFKIEHLMEKDSYPRFLKSDIYQDLLAASKKWPSVLVRPLTLQSDCLEMPLYRTFYIYILYIYVYTSPRIHCRNRPTRMERGHLAALVENFNSMYSILSYTFTSVDVSNTISDVFVVNIKKTAWRETAGIKNLVPIKSDV